MRNPHRVDITELAVLGEQFPLRLMQLGFRLVQVLDDTGHDLFRYVIAPVCLVPAGPFLMGSDPHQDAAADANELPQHVVVLPAFAISTYPLTVAEYDCFVRATRHREPGTSYGRSSWQQQCAERMDHPVAAVSGEDILAYADFLTQVTGERWRLPTEAEWEKAARGTDGRIFPWGNDWDPMRANTEDDGPGRTTPVGTYADGVSPYGCCDMAGNVWEWTSTVYRRYPYRGNDGREDLRVRKNRVLRGGSWSHRPNAVRVACRMDFVWSNVFDGFGGRLVCENPMRL